MLPGHEIRCPSRIVGIVSEDGSMLEVKCPSKHCGAGNGVVVMHHYLLSTGELSETKKYKDPARIFEPTKKEAAPAWP